MNIILSQYNCGDRAQLRLIKAEPMGEPFTHKPLCSTYLLINGGIAAGCGHPHLLIEPITDGVRQVNAGVSVTSKDSPVQREGGRERGIKRERQREGKNTCKR